MTLLAEILPTLSISFPKRVRIENTRLAIMYWFLCAAVISFVCYNSYVSQAYLIRQDPHAHFSFWTTRWKVDSDAAMAINNEEAGTAHCKDLDDFAFCDSADCSGKSAKQMQCVNLCTDGMLSDCIEMPERYMQDSDSLFVPTFFHEMEFLRETDDSGGVIKRKASETWRVVKGATEMGVEFDHEYMVKKPTSGGHEVGSNTLKKSNLLTILHDASGKEVQSWAPGESISLNMVRILQEAGIDLDQIEKDLGQNQLKDAKHPEGILKRIAGAKIWINVYYYNKLQHSVDWNGPVAIIRIMTTESASWVFRPVTEVLDKFGSQRVRNYHGIQIRFASGGSWAFYSTDQIIGMVTSILVFMGLAKQAVYFFTLRCIGLISEVYRGFLYQQCSLSKECCALAARLCSHTSTFVELKDLEDGISRTRILRRFTRIFKPFEDELDPHEVDRLTSFVFDHIRKQQRLDEKLNAAEAQHGSIESSLSKSPADSTKARKQISMEGFGWACSHGEPLKLRTMIKVFDATRRKNWLEKLFSGPDLKKLFITDAAVRNSEYERRTTEVSPSTTAKHSRSPGHTVATQRETPPSEANREGVVASIASPMVQVPPPVHVGHVACAEHSAELEEVEVACGTGGSADMPHLAQGHDLKEVKSEVTALRIRIEELAIQLGSRIRNCQDDVREVRSHVDRHVNKIEDDVHKSGKIAHAKAAAPDVARLSSPTVSLDDPLLTSSPDVAEESKKKKEMKPPAINKRDSAHAEELLDSARSMNIKLPASAITIEKDAELKGGGESKKSKSSTPTPEPPPEKDKSALCGCA